MTSWTRPEQPYAESGQLDMPVHRPDEPAGGPDEAERTDGTTCDWRATLGLRPPGEVSPDDRVHDWRPV